MAPTISLASSDADVSTVSLVVLPPDVAEGIVLATSDPYVSAIRCFSHCSWLTIYIYMGSGMWIILLLFPTIVHCRCHALSFGQARKDPHCLCTRVSRSLNRRSLTVLFPSVSQHYQVGSCSLYPFRSIERFDVGPWLGFFYGHFPLAPLFTCIYSGGIYWPTG